MYRVRGWFWQHSREYMHHCCSSTSGRPMKKAHLVSATARHSGGIHRAEASSWEPRRHTCRISTNLAVQVKHAADRTGKKHSEVFGSAPLPCCSLVVTACTAVPVPQTTLAHSHTPILACRSISAHYPQLPTQSKHQHTMHACMDGYNSHVPHRHADFRAL